MGVFCLYGYSWFNDNSTCYYLYNQISTTVKTLQILPLAAKGTKIKFVKPINQHWFYNVVNDQKFLEIGKVYTVDKVEMASSATYVWLEEIPIYDSERQLPFFNYHSFEIVNED